MKKNVAIQSNTDVNRAIMTSRGPTSASRAINRTIFDLILSSPPLSPSSVCLNELSDHAISRKDAIIAEYWNISERNDIFLL